MRTTLDLATVRETLSYVYDDVSRDASTQRVARAIETVIAEISLVEAQQVLPPRAVVQHDAVFLPHRVVK
ncbi:MAG: hypothetical protein AAFR04_11410 [Pseudomonadota bacterium]